MFFHQPPRQQSYEQTYYQQPPPQQHPHPWGSHSPYQGMPHQSYNYHPGYMNQAPYQQGYSQGYTPGPGSKLMSAFQTEEGKFDFQKAMTTVDQVVKTANQVSPLVKQVGSFFITKS